jgi:hypothetical protein
MFTLTDDSTSQKRFHLLEQCNVHPAIKLPGSEISMFLIELYLGIGGLFSSS